MLVLPSLGDFNEEVGAHFYVLRGEELIPAALDAGGVGDEVNEGTLVELSQLVPCQFKSPRTLSMTTAEAFSLDKESSVRWLSELRNHL